MPDVLPRYFALFVGERYERVRVLALIGLNHRFVLPVTLFLRAQFFLDLGELFRGRLVDSDL